MLFSTASLRAANSSNTPLKGSQWTVNPYDFLVQLIKSTLASGQGSWCCPAPVCWREVWGTVRDSCLPSAHARPPAPPMQGAASGPLPLHLLVATLGPGSGLPSGRWILWKPWKYRIMRRWFGGGVLRGPRPKRARSTGLGRGRDGPWSRGARATAHPTGSAGAGGGLQGRGRDSASCLTGHWMWVAQGGMTLHSGLLLSGAVARETQLQRGPRAPGSCCTSLGPAAPPVTPGVHTPPGKSAPPGLWLSPFPGDT